MLSFRDRRTSNWATWWATWGHDTFMCGLDFLNLDLSHNRHGLLAKLVLLVYFDPNHSELAQATTVACFPTKRDILELGDGSVA